jgi:argininosuccinate synthase
VPWLKNNYGCEVICFCANLGQADELVGLEEKALASGASKCYIEDLRLEFLTDYVFPTMQAGAIYERDYLLGTSFARPLIAKKWWRSPNWKAPTRSPTAPPARATTRCASS